MSGLLEHTRKKVRAALAAIDSIKAFDFPYEDAGKVLSIVEDEFTSLRNDLTISEPDSDADALRAMCQRAIEAVDQYLPILGYLVRSADLDGPVEIQGPLLRLTHKAIDADAALVIFSEWHYSPFTAVFPELYQRGVVLVGMPSSEANNALIAPAAGHELGHNIWIRYDYESKLMPQVEGLVVADMKANWEKNWKDLGGTSDILDDLLGVQYYGQPSRWGIRQCEETFCDFIGLFIFREAYLHSFEYLLAPGSNDRLIYEYPNLRDRASNLSVAAAKYGISVPNRFTENFRDARPAAADDFRRLIGELADLSCKRLAEEIAKLAYAFVEAHGLSDHDPSDISRAAEAFRRVVPASQSKGIGNIINAAWIVANDSENFLLKHYPRANPDDKDEILNELVLKSFEVFEIEQRVGAT